ISYHIGDVFTQSPEGVYDLVNWDHSLHHMPDVDEALAWSVKVLRAGGYIMVNDYIGPNRLQFPRTEIDQANKFLTDHGIPRKVRRSTLITKLKQWYRDPSEAPQSEQISDAVARRLPGVRFAPIGGVLLNILGGV